MDGHWVKPVVRTLADQVADTILEGIARGHYKAGETLPSQRALAQRLGVGLAVVREAIQRLQILRILSAKQGRGTIVESVGWTQLMFEPSLGILALERHAIARIWEARNGIEKETALLATRRATAADLATMRAIIEQAGDGLEKYDDNHRLNHAFHGAIASASKNTVLVEMLEPLLRIDVGMKRKVYDVGLSRRSWQVHRRIFEAIESRDEAAVAAAMADHASALDAEMHKFEAVLREQAGAAERFTMVG
ncbi:MAG: FadR family transcriptional regulator [Rhodospirillaceae bacterium]|jgi:DNA-binding FadR family transcriptional regulator|nr:FadR family transcriptional regulator [Rhodospirillaceae bacterium]